MDIRNIASMYRHCWLFEVKIYIAIESIYRLAVIQIIISTKIMITIPPPMQAGIITLS